MLNSLRSVQAEFDLSLYHFVSKKVHSFKNELLTHAKTFRKSINKPVSAVEYNQIILVTSWQNPPSRALVQRSGLPWPQ